MRGTDLEALRPCAGSPGSRLPDSWYIVSVNVREFWQFLVSNKKWWLTPIIVFVLLFGALVLLGGTGDEPFVYTVF